MATDQGWKDFERVVSTVERTKDTLGVVNNIVEELKILKAEIMDDTTRRAEMKELVDCHPNFTITGLQTEFQKMIALQTFLEDNDYIGE